MAEDLEAGYNDIGSEESRNRRAEDAEASRSFQTSDPETAPKKPKTAKELEEEKNRKAVELFEEEQRHKEELRRQKELEFKRYKRKLITPGVVLVTGLIASITMYFAGFENRRMLVWLLVILFVSWIVGGLIHYMFDKFADENENVVSEEGEVINKGTVKAEEVKAEENG